MFWRLVQLACVAVMVLGCSITQPVAVIDKKGMVLRGTATATLTGGSFQATNGKLTCSGTYDSTSGSITLNAKVICSDGRTGFAIITRDKGLQSGAGRVRLTDGTEADFIFGPAAEAF